MKVRTTHWTLGITCWGWSLFFDGDLVASANDPLDLIELTLELRGGQG